MASLTAPRTDGAMPGRAIPRLSPVRIMSYPESYAPVNDSHLRRSTRTVRRPSAAACTAMPVLAWSEVSATQPGIARQVVTHGEAFSLISVSGSTVRPRPMSGVSANGTSPDRNRRTYKGIVAVPDMPWTGRHPAAQVIRVQWSYDSVRLTRSVAAAAVHLLSRATHGHRLEPK